MAKPQRLTYLKLQISDYPGALLEVMKALKEKNISLKSLWGYSKENGVADVFIVGKDEGKVQRALPSSITVLEKSTVFFLQGTDKAGALLKMLQILADARINIRALHAIAVSGKYGSLLWVNEGDIEKTARVLGAK
ncbi:MAG: hypothetical protein N3A63_08850 [Bacteroidetes bacterium]|nr:hypothetical protein [Bacteroidota bacterium]